jgi:deoxyribodipyrimidine photolyase-related protein
VTRNALGHDRALPGFYWTADTRMRCVARAVEQTRDEAYAHHIQRLMVTGNFALLAGIDPHRCTNGISRSMPTPMNGSRRPTSSA